MQLNSLYLISAVSVFTAVVWFVLRAKKRPQCKPEGREGVTLKDIRLAQRAERLPPFNDSMVKQKDIQRAFKNIFAMVPEARREAMIKSAQDKHNFTREEAMRQLIVDRYLDQEYSK